MVAMPIYGHATPFSRRHRRPRRVILSSLLLALWARALAKFDEVDTVPVSEKPSALSTFRPLGYPIKS